MRSARVVAPAIINALREVVLIFIKMHRWDIQLLCWFKFSLHFALKVEKGGANSLAPAPRAAFSQSGLSPMLPL
jgi:hypothetical protein